MLSYPSGMTMSSHALNLLADLLRGRRTERGTRWRKLHPRVGRLLLDCETLVTPDQHQQLLVLTPADADSRERLELLQVLGIEEFPTGATDMPMR
jgi:hypothetical protein